MLTQRGPCRDGEDGANPGSRHFSATFKKVKSAIYRGGFRDIHITAKNSTEAIQQRAVNNQFQLVLILVGYKPVTYGGNNTMQYQPPEALDNL